MMTGLRVVGGVLRWPGAVLAYIDPGSAGVILQFALMALGGILVTVRIFWSRLKRLLSFGRREEDLS